MAIYVKIEGIDGICSAAGYEKWIEMDSLQFGCGRAITMATGRQTARECSIPSFSEVTMSKAMDDSSPYLLQAAITSDAKEVKIHVTKSGTKKIECVVEYILTAGLLSGYSISSGGDRPQESISVNYTKIEMKYVAWDEKNKKSGQTPVSFDLGTGEPG